MSTFYPIDYIATTVSEFYGISKTQIASQRRMLHVVQARHVAMYFARRHSGMSLESVGRHFGGKDHSTVMNAVSSIEKKIASDSSLAEQVKRISQMLVKGCMNTEESTMIETNRLVISVHGATNEAWKLLAAGAPIREIIGLLESGGVLQLAQQISEFNAKAVVEKQVAA